jgi:DUF917 family protein
VGFYDGKPRVTVPDLICVLDTASGEAIGTETLRYGAPLPLVRVSNTTSAFGLPLLPWRS